MAKRKKETFKRIDVETVLPKTFEPLNVNRIIRLAKAAQKAMLRERKLYGKSEFTNIDLSS